MPQKRPGETGEVVANTLENKKAPTAARQVGAIDFCFETRFCFR